DEYWDGLEDHTAACKIVVALMRDLVNHEDDRLLQAVLGYGFVFIADHYAYSDFDTERNNANVFRSVLARHPEWRSKFRALTRFGNITSYTAALGRSIPHRDSHGEDYY
ncbi:hypothetical protein PFISCL1PPCAC_18867, partial [Pristionchus fissidentatus]